MRNIYAISTAYLFVSFFILYFIFHENLLYELLARGSGVLLLGTLYFFNVEKEKKNWLYPLLLLCIGVGQLFFSQPENYFAYTIVTYSMAHIIFMLLIYNNFLKQKSPFEIFTFSLPFMLTLSIICILLDFNFYWGIGIFVIGILACLNGSMVLLNYATETTVRNYILFIGYFIWFIVDELAGVFMFGKSEEVYYLFTVILDLLAQYLICRALIFNKRIVIN